VGSFDEIVRATLVEMIEKRVTDGSVLRLIGKWIKVGVIEDGRLLVSETGTGQGQPISPLLANIYLHYVLDEWFEEVVKPRLKGEAYEIRFADDAILCFQHKEDAEKVMRVLPKRFEKYGLTLHPEKTRLIEFGRYAVENTKKQGKEPETFDFLGYVFLPNMCSQIDKLLRFQEISHIEEHINFAAERSNSLFITRRRRSPSETSLNSG
jgi:RNA-directed DNA polymerase